MADIRNSKAFKALAAQTEAELLTRGLDVVSVAVHNVLAHNVTLVAERLGIQPRSALRYIEPAAVADQIAQASAPDTEGSHTVHGVRPVRVDDRTVPVPAGSARLLDTPDAGPLHGISLCGRDVSFVPRGPSGEEGR